MTLSSFILYQMKHEYDLSPHPRFPNYIIERELLTFPSGERVNLRGRDEVVSRDAAGAVSDAELLMWLAP